MTAPGLVLDKLEKRFGSTVTAAGIDLSLKTGEFFTLLGPSGSGKSTVLRMIAGLESPDAGRILLDGRDITRLPPWRRGLGMVFQQYAIFPHMNVAENVAYSLRRSSLSPADRTARVEELLTMVGLAEFGPRRVTQLSGGEQQRVAIARALAPRPRILLLDEPLSALDEKIRREMQEELRRIQQDTGTTFVYVTHDQEEALTMSDRIAVLNRGHMIQCDMPERLFRRPRTRFVAEFFRGCNVIEGTGADGRISLAGSALDLAAPAGAVALAIRGEDVHLGLDAAGCEARLGAVLEGAVYRGLYTDYRLRLDDGQTLSAMTARADALQPGARVEIGFDLSAVTVLEDA
jgi:ABC-type Fe3+/spermidine/putrescine transport system ATPase subunit